MHGEGGVCVICTAGHCAGGTHPTGMHSCYLDDSIWYRFAKIQYSRL